MKIHPIVSQQQTGISRVQKRKCFTWKNKTKRSTCKYTYHISLQEFVLKNCSQTLRLHMILRNWKEKTRKDRNESKKCKYEPNNFSFILSTFALSNKKSGVLKCSNFLQIFIILFVVFQYFIIIKQQKQILLLQHFLDQNNLNQLDF